MLVVRECDCFDRNTKLVVQRRCKRGERSFHLAVVILRTVGKLVFKIADRDGIAVFFEPGGLGAGER